MKLNQLLEATTDYSDRGFSQIPASLVGQKEHAGRLLLTRNNLTSLEGCPEQIIGDFSCSLNPIKTLESGPKKVFGNYYCYECKIRSLVGIEKYVDTITGEFVWRGNPIGKGGLGLLKIKGLTQIDVNFISRNMKDEYLHNKNDFAAAAIIMNKYLKEKYNKAEVCTTSQILKCKAELERAGLSEFAIL